MSKQKIKKSRSLFSLIDTDNLDKHQSKSGIGVGLSSSYKLAKGMGGTLDIDSDIGRGTEVKFSVLAYSESKDKCNEPEYNLNEEDSDVNISDINNIFVEKFNYRKAQMNQLAFLQSLKEPEPVKTQRRKVATQEIKMTKHVSS